MINLVLSLINWFWELFMMPRCVQKGKRCRMRFNNGRSVYGGGGNLIIIGNECFLMKCSFVVKGNNNVIKIENKCKLTGVSFWISGDNNVITIGEGTSVGLRTQFAALEGTKVTIGKDCMFSHDIRIRTSDSHSIIDEGGNRINYAEDVVIGNHCWIGMQSLIMKGSVLGNNSVLAARSLLNKKFQESGCIVAGSPAKVIKDNINWDRRKL